MADSETLARLEGEGRIAFRYDPEEANPNGSAAGILDAAGRVLGMMPHPERAVDPAVGGIDVAALFAGLAGAALTVRGHGHISIDSLRATHESWLPRFMAGP